MPDTGDTKPKQPSAKSGSAESGAAKSGSAESGSTEQTPEDPDSKTMIPGNKWLWILAAIAVAVVVIVVIVVVVNSSSDEPTTTTIVDTTAPPAKETSTTLAAATTTETSEETTTSVPDDTISDGTYLAGTDIDAGIYKGDVKGPSAYWQISRDANGLEVIVREDVSGQFYLEVKDGQFLKLYNVTISLEE